MLALDMHASTQLIRSGPRACCRLTTVKPWCSFPSSRLLADVADMEL